MKWAVEADGLSPHSVYTHVCSHHHYLPCACYKLPAFPGCFPFPVVQSIHLLPEGAPWLWPVVCFTTQQNKACQMVQHRNGVESGNMLESPNSLSVA